MKVREYSHTRERVHSVRRPRFVEKEKAVDAETDEAEEYSQTRERVHSVRRPRFVEKEKLKTDEAEGILTG
jgi:hypothetical protein